MSKKNSVYILLFFILLGVGVRAYMLTSRSLWFDEAFSWRLILFPFNDLFFRNAADVHPPLYYMVLKIWSFIFESSLQSLRSFSVFMAGLTIGAGYLFASTAFRSRATGLLAAALLATSGFQIQFAWEARMYTFGTFFALLSSWILIKALRRRPQKIRIWLAYAFVTALLAYVHYYALFTIAAQVIFLLGYILIKTRGRIGEIIQWSVTRNIFLAGAFMALLYAPWMKYFILQNSQVQQAYWIPPIGGWSIPDTFYRMFKPTSGIPTHEGLFWIIIAMMPLVLTLLGWSILALSRKNKLQKVRDASWLVLASGAIPFAISILLSFVGQSLYQDRFFVFAHLFIVIGLAHLIMNLRPAWLRLSTGALVTIAFFAAFIIYWNELEIQKRPGAHAATQAIFNSTNADEPVIATSPFIFFAILHYAEEEFDVPRSIGDNEPSLQTPKLYSESGELAHFAGGPILLSEDIVGPEIFNNPEINSLWIVDTTGFGSTKLDLPAQWRAKQSQMFPEVFAHQADVFITLYSK